jgi:putative tryptophan/tyrosine transport system substrate-binding protein
VANLHVPLSSWRRVRGSLDWLALAGHRRGHPMKRREFIAATAALLVSPRRSRAQGARRRLGVLAINEMLPNMQNAWLDGLRNHGWIDGRNLIIEYRYARSQGRLPALAAELVALGPDLLIAANPQSAVALKSATANIPIVFVAVSDPVGIGLVQGLSRPGGNITGLATFVPGQFTSKMIETLREMVPTASKIAILVNPGNPIHRLIVAEELPRAGQDLRVALPIVEASTAEELDIAFASAAAQHADAIIVFGDPLTIQHAPRVIALAAKHRLPASYLFRQFATNGGLISYGPDLDDLWLRAGGYVDKILKGTKPSDLPVEQPTKFELVINMKTAKALGLTVPPSLLVRANEVIE